MINGQTMNKYELVIVCNASLTKAEHADVTKQVEEVFQSNILDKDDLGVMQLAYKNTKEKSAHIVSYHLQCSPEEVETKKKGLIYIKWISKFVIFSMTNKQKFFKFAELEKTYQEKFAESFQPKKI